MNPDGDCGSDHCVTCSDEGVPMRIVEPPADGVAVCVDAGGSRSAVMTDLVPSAALGDAVLVHAGVALARLEAGALA